MREKADIFKTPMSGVLESQTKGVRVTFALLSPRPDAPAETERGFGTLP